MYCEHTEDAARHAITLQLLSANCRKFIAEKEQDEQA